PLCVASERWPSILDSLLKAAAKEVKPDPCYPEDMVFLDTELFYTVGFPKEGVYLSPESRSFLKMASERPLSPIEAAEEMGTAPSFIGVRSLEAHGYVDRIAFTPTDVLHVDGTYTEYDREASILGARYLAKKCGKTPGTFVSECRDLVKAKLCAELMKVILADELGDHPLEPYAASMILKAALGKGKDFSCALRLNMPLIGIGAPASTYIRWVGDAFGTRTYIDPDSDVGNAVGAIASSISETVEVLVSPEDLDSPESLFEMFSPEGKETCSSLEEALRLAEETGKRIARERAERSGACSIAYDVVRSDHHMGLRGMDVLVECVISVTAAGMPSMFGAENL
ncbi:MAG: hypothetical protein IKP18_03245, partial [Candidatus Methanomethylophilaceae archaeon]|nr:hypothetical protein [Candidatus Methanomethylophilaceae archaeon]